MISDRSATRDHLNALTGLRIFAALAVYFSHVAHPAGAPAAVTAFMDSGYYGVTLFFVLSGFVLSLNYFDELRRPRASAIWTFAAARFARVYPLYLLVLMYLVARSTVQGVAIDDSWLEHALALQAWDADLGRAYAFNSPAWSVGVEFFLYAAFPLLVPAIARFDWNARRLLTAIAVTIALMVALTAWFMMAGRGDIPWSDPGSAHRWLYRTPLPRLGDFILGILAARLFVRLRERRGMGQLGAVLIGSSLAVIGLLASSTMHLYTVPSWDLSYALPAFGLILGLALAPRNAVARFLSLPVIVLLGEASYAFYLIHVPMLSAIGSTAWSSAVNVWTVFVALTTLATVLIAAVGLHVLIERPARFAIRRLIARVPRRLARRSRPGASIA